MAVTTTRIERSGPAIHAALAEHAPAECAQFEMEFRRATVEAAELFDLAPVAAVLDRWWGVAAIRANPLSEVELGLVARARAGDTAGWAVREEDQR